MQIQKHIDAKKLAMWQNELFLLGGMLGLMTMFGFSVTKGSPASLVVLLLAAVCLGFYLDRTVAPYRRFKKVLAVLEEHPKYTFTQIAIALQLKPKAVRSMLRAGIQRGVLVQVKIDKEDDRLKSTARPRRPVRVESFLTVSCPNCGAACEISSVYGGQCEYCDTHLPGKE